MNFRDIVALAAQSLHTNRLRTALTMMIIAVGLTALVGILTALDSFIFTMSDNFSTLGTGSFNIVSGEQQMRSRRKGKQQKRNPNISLNQAIHFKKRFENKSLVSIGFLVTTEAVIKYQNKKTNPNISVRAIDENYALLHKKSFAAGRNFTKTEIDRGHRKCILGRHIVNTLFEGSAEKAVGKTIQINAVKYKVIGVLQPEGSTMNQNTGRQVMLPPMAAKSQFAARQFNTKITVSALDSPIMDELVDEAIGTMRLVRRLDIGQENNFNIEKSDAMIQMLRDNTKKIRLAALVIALMTILSSAVGLMNIMLVSVTERTREIGISKALGATRRHILMQFLLEASLICFIGGFLGIVLGSLFGNLVVFLIGGSFFLPWNWIALGLFSSIAVGLAAGFYPAKKASKLHPVDALRYE